MQAFFFCTNKAKCRKEKNEVAVPYYRFPSAGASMFVEHGVLMVVDFCAHLKLVVLEAVMFYPNLSKCEAQHYR